MQCYSNFRGILHFFNAKRKHKILNLKMFALDNFIYYLKEVIRVEFSRFFVFGRD